MQASAETPNTQTTVVALTVCSIILISANLSISFLLNFSHTADLLIAHRLMVHSFSKVRGFKQSHIGSLRQSHLLISHNSLTHEQLCPIILLGPLIDKVLRHTRFPVGERIFTVEAFGYNTVAI